jgi:hypothetical protein
MYLRHTCLSVRYLYAHEFRKTTLSIPCTELSQQIMSTHQFKILVLRKVSLICYHKITSISKSSKEPLSSVFPTAFCHSSDVCYEQPNNIRPTGQQSKAANLSSPHENLRDLLNFQKIHTNTKLNNSVLALSLGLFLFSCHLYSRTKSIKV